MTKYLLLVLLMMSSAMAYSLDISTDRCEFYFHGGSSELSSDVDDLLKVVKSGEAVKVCTGNNENKTYYVASAVSEQNGVSYFYLTRVFKVSVSNGYRWEFIPPKDSLLLTAREVYMQSLVGGDIHQDHSGFVQVKGVSVGLFSVLNKAWNSILSSEELFGEASSNLSMFSKLSLDIKALKRALYDDDRKNVPKLLTVSFIEGSDSSFPHYTFSVVDKTRMWNIGFDFNGNTIRFESVVLVSG